MEAKNNSGRDSRGRFKKGEAPGRPYGAKNKVNRVRDGILSFWEEIEKDPVNNIKSLFDGLESNKDKLDFLMKCLPYLIGRIDTVAPEEAGDTKDPKEIKLKVIGSRSQPSIREEQKSS